jgi:hypothetical protein
MLFLLMNCADWPSNREQKRMVGTLETGKGTTFFQLKYKVWM